MVLPPENLKIWVDSREYLRQLQTAIYLPFTKGPHTVSLCHCTTVSPFTCSQM